MIVDVSNLRDIYHFMVGQLLLENRKVGLEQWVHLV